MRASRSWGQADSSYMAAMTPVVPRDSVSLRDSPVAIGRASRSAKSRFRRVAASAVEVVPSGQSAFFTQSAAKAWNAVSKPAVWSRFSSTASSDGSIAPSRTRRPTRAGKSPAYVAPRKVPYDAPT